MTAAAYLLDSDIIIDALNGKKGRHVLLDGLLREGRLLACCAINVTEVYAGVRPHEEERTREFIDCLGYYAVTREIAREAGLLKRHWSRKGTTLSLADASIAAVALANDLPLITGNAKHYPMPELRLVPLLGQRG
jgi:predicted nucleic acid-binding protein